MTAVDAVAQVAQLGGAGAGMQLALRGVSIVSDLIAKNDAQRVKEIEEENRADLGKWQAVRKVVSGQGGKWIYRLFAATCVFIVVSPLVLPLIKPDVVMHWFVPKDINWLVFQTEKMKEYVIGNPESKSAIHVSLFPFMYAFANNVAWFYLCGKPFKK